MVLKLSKGVRAGLPAVLLLELDRRLGEPPGSEPMKSRNVISSSSEPVLLSSTELIVVVFVVLGYRLVVVVVVVAVCVEVVSTLGESIRGMGRLLMRKTPNLSLRWEAEMTLLLRALVPEVLGDARGLELPVDAFERLLGLEGDAGSSVGAGSDESVGKAGKGGRSRAAGSANGFGNA